MVDPKWKLNMDARIKSRFIREMESQNKTVSDDDITAYIKKYNGEFVFLWHNSSFSATQWIKYQDIYERVILNQNLEINKISINQE
jgi:hypothetical protein